MTFRMLLNRRLIAALAALAALVTDATADSTRYHHGSESYTIGPNDNYAYPETDGESGTVVTRSAAEIQRQRNEETARKADDLHWLDESFAYAKRIGAKGVLIDWQADPNFNNEQHRVETFGARQTHWLSATIDPRDPNLFEFEPQIVPANVG